MIRKKWNGHWLRSWIADAEAKNAQLERELEAYKKSLKWVRSLLTIYFVIHGFSF